MREPATPSVEPLEPRLLFTAVPLITEFVAANDNLLFDEDGDSSDWIELYNDGDSVLDLTGWYLTDDDGELDQWAFPAVSLDPGQFLIVFASDKDRADADGTELHTNFKLGAGGEYLALVRPDGVTVAHEYAPEYPEQEEDVSYGLAMETVDSVLIAEGSDARYLVPAAEVVGWETPLFDDGAWAVGTSGFGYEGSAGSSLNYLDLIETTLPSGTTSVYLRQTFDVATPTSLSGLTLNVRYDDGFAVFLNGTRINGDNDPATLTFDAVATGSHVDSSAVDLMPFDLSDHLGLLVAGTNVLAVQGLNLPGSSDYLIEVELVGSTTRVVSPQLEGYLATSTPGARNGQSFLGFVDDTAFSVDRGFYDTPFDLAITTPTAGASVAYTLDGSEPTVDAAGNILNGMLYTGAIHIAGTTTVRAIGFQAGFEPTNIDTHSYIFAADVINQDETYTLAQGFPALWDTVVPDYGVEVPLGQEAAFTSALTAIPTISINLDAQELFGPDGIYTNSGAHGINWERAASVEWINPDGSVGFQEDAGLRIQGGAFRSHDLTKKHSFRLIFRDEYGVGRLAFPLFGPDAADDFNTITLRGESNDGWSWDSALGQPQYARDQFGHLTQLAMGQPSSHGTRAHLYLNGVYWGIYNPVERPDANFAADYYGGDADDWDVINSGDPTDGDLVAWQTLIALAQAVADAPDEASRTAAYYHLMGLNPDGTNNPLAENYLDAVNYVDYLLVNYYGGNGDWPHKNYYTARERGVDSTGFKFHMWDAEWTLGLRSNENANRLGLSTGVAEPYSDLILSEEFRVLFADRAHRALFNGGPLTTAEATARYEGIIAELDGAIAGEAGRWGDQHIEPGYGYADWLAESQAVINDWIAVRTDIFIGHLVAAGLYSSLEAVSWNQRGGPVASEFGVELTAPEGTIYYTTDGSDPRLIGGGVSASAIAYAGPIVLTDTAHLRARVLHNGVWSAIDQADFVVADTVADASNLRITEVHYHPADPSAAEIAAGFDDADGFEFIELMNVSGQTISLHGVSLGRAVVGAEVEGVRFTFGAVALRPGERVVVVNDAAAFQQRYGAGVAVAGEFEGNLSNAAETLTLTDADGATIRQFRYSDDDVAGWPGAADGGGPSLVALRTNGDYADPLNWTTSATTHGTPGGNELGTLTGDIDADGFVGSTDLDLVLALWSDPAASSTLADAADMNLDGTVGLADLRIVAAYWGTGALPSQPTSNPDAVPPGPSPADPAPTRPAGTPVAGGRGDGNTRPVPTRPATPTPTPTPTRPTRPVRPGSATNPPPAQRPAPQLPATQPPGAQSPRADALALSRPATPTAPPPAEPAATPARRFDAMQPRPPRG